MGYEQSIIRVKMHWNGLLTKLSGKHSALERCSTISFIQRLKNREPKIQPWHTFEVATGLDNWPWINHGEMKASLKLSSATLEYVIEL